jgi:hypothetical protein
MIRLDGIVIDDPVSPGAESGVIQTYATVTIATDGGKIKTLFVTYLRYGQFLPKRRERCRIVYVDAAIRGMVRATPLYLDAAPLMQSMRCGSGFWAGDQNYRRAIR